MRQTGRPPMIASRVGDANRMEITVLCLRSANTLHGFRDHRTASFLATHKTLFTHK